MTDKELTIKIATGVMGWHLADHPEKNGTGQWMSDYEYEQWFNSVGEMVGSNDWDPFTDRHRLHDGCG